MVISEQDSFCFIAVPKTGTTALTRQLMSNPHVIRNKLKVDGDEIHIHEHSTAREIAQILGEERWSKLYTFAFVRNPWDRIVSSYFYYRNGRAAETVMTGKNKQYLKKNMRNKLYLNVALAKLLPFSIWVWLCKTQQYVDFVTDHQGNIIVSDIFKFEELEDGFNSACERIGLTNLTLVKENASKHDKYQKYYNRISRCLVASRYAKDIKMFNYEFEAK